MTALALLPALLSCLLLALHFFRNGNSPALVLALLMLPLLWVRRPWASRILQGFLLLAAFEWARTTLALTAERQALGVPYLRLAAILASVALVAALASFLLLTTRLRDHFRRPRKQPEPERNPAIR